MPRYRPRPSRAHLHQAHEPPLNPPAILLRKSAASKPASPRLSLTSVDHRRVSFDLAVSQTTLSTNVTRRAKKAGPPSSYADPIEPSSPTAAESSSSTLASSNASVTLSQKPESYCESGDESNLESDSSHISSVSSLQRRSLSITAHLPSVKSVFLKRANRRSAPPSLLSLDSDSLRDSDLTSLNSPTRPETPKSARRSMQIISSWSNIRQRQVSEPVADGQSTPTPRSTKRFSLPAMCSPRTPTSFFKSDCQSPAPVPRTQPYGPPYYAQAPTSVDASLSYHAKASRYVDDDASSLSSANSGWTQPSRSQAPHPTLIGYGPPPRSARRIGDDWARSRAPS